MKNVWPICVFLNVNLYLFVCHQKQQNQLRFKLELRMTNNRHSAMMKLKTATVQNKILRCLTTEKLICHFSELVHRKTTGALASVPTHTFNLIAGFPYQWVHKLNCLFLCCYAMNVQNLSPVVLTHIIIINNCIENDYLTVHILACFVLILILKLV